MKANKLFVFQPANSWTYCGGLTIICANSIEDAILIGCDYPKDGEDWEKCEFSLIQPTNEKDFHRTWVLTKEFTLAEPADVGVTLQNYNYA